MASGIVLRANTSTVLRSSFQNIVRGAYGLVPNFQNYGYGIQYIDAFGVSMHTFSAARLNFNHVEFGIYAGTHKINTRANIIECNMTDVFRGITLISPNNPVFGTVGNLTEANVLRNAISSTLDNTAFAGTMPDVVTGYYGIHISDFNPVPSNYNVQTNNITINNPAAQNVNGARGYGIYVQGIGRGFIDNTITTSITHNNVIDMITGESGIELKNTWNANVLDNSINMDVQNATFPGGGVNPIVHGIKAEGGGEHTLSCNEIVRDPNMLAGIEFHGIVTDNSPGIHYNFNRIFGAAQFATDYAMTFRKNCEGFVGCNEMTAPFNIGVLYHSEFVNGAWVNDGFTGAQDETGNKWFENGNTFGFGAYYTGTQYQGQKWRVNPMFNLSPPIDPATGGMDVNPATGWFFDDGITNPECTCVLNPGGGGGDDTMLSSLDEELAPQFEDLNSWNHRAHTTYRRLKKKLSENPELLNQSSEMQDFLVAFDNSQEGLLWQNQTAAFGLFNQSEGGWDEIQTNNAQVEQWENELTIVFEQLGQDPNNTGLIQDANNLQNSIDMLNLNSMEIFDGLDEARANVATELLAELEAINPESDFGKNEKTVYSILLKWIAISDYSSYTDDLEQLRQIATTCPEVGGDAVWFAQTLYYNATDEILHYSDCAATERALPSVEDESDIMVFPNPTSESFIIQTKEKISKVEIFDLRGRLLRELYPPSESAVKISTMDLSNGIYNVRISLIGQSPQIKSLVVIK